jgi:Electron transfer DM13
MGSWRNARHAKEVASALPDGWAVSADVHVYLVAADDATDNKSVMNARFIDLGSIKGNIGDQNYTLGSDVDLSKYRAVSVWCKRFSVNFGAAALSKDRVAQR